MSAPCRLMISSRRSASVAPTCSWSTPGLVFGGQFCRRYYLTPVERGGRGSADRLRGRVGCPLVDRLCHHWRSTAPASPAFTPGVCHTACDAIRMPTRLRCGARDRCRSMILLWGDSNAGTYADDDVFRQGWGSGEERAGGPLPRPSTDNPSPYRCALGDDCRPSLRSSAILDSYDTIIFARGTVRPSFLHFLPRVFEHCGR